MSLKIQSQDDYSLVFIFLIHAVIAVACFLVQLENDSYMNKFSNFDQQRSVIWSDIIVVFVITSMVYIWSAPRTVVLEDDGLIILVSYCNGAAHPLGSPYSS